MWTKHFVQSIQHNVINYRKKSHQSGYLTGYIIMTWENIYNIVRENRDFKFLHIVWVQFYKMCIIILEKKWNKLEYER